MKIFMFVFGIIIGILFTIGCFYNQSEYFLKWDWSLRDGTKNCLELWHWNTPNSSTGRDVFCVNRSWDIYKNY